MTALRKTHWLRTTLIVLIVCGVLGAALAAVQFLGNPDPATMSATLQFSFTDAANGIAPNGNAFNPNELTSDSVLEAALAEAGLTDTYTPEALRKCLTVTGVYPDTLLKQAQDTSSLLTGQASQDLAILNYHPTVFTVKITNLLEPALGNQQLRGLLESVLNAYRDYFTKQYAENLEPDVMAYDRSGYDYVQQLDILEQNIRQVARFADELYGRRPTFTLQGKGFNDISTQLNALIRTEVTRLNATITMNSLTRDVARLLTQYQYEISDLTNQISRLEEAQKKLDALIAAYEKNEIIYLSTADSVTQIAGDSNATYNALIEIRQENALEISRMNSQISQYQQLITDLTGSSDSGSAAKAPETGSETASGSEEAVQEMTEAEIAAAAEAAQEAMARQLGALETSIDSLIARRDAILAEFRQMLEAYNSEEINEDTVEISRYRLVTPSLISGQFVKLVIKTAGPFCALGLMVCLVLLIRSRKKESAASSADQ